MISYLLDPILKLQESDSFETLTGAPRANPWPRFITRANVRSMRCASSEKCAGRHVGVGMGYVGVSREDVAAAIMRRHAGREGGE